MKQKFVTTAVVLLILTLLTGCSDADQPSPPYAVAGSQLPGLAPHPDGSVVMSWIEKEADGHRLRVARYKDGRWRAARTVARGNNWFVNWADFPSVRVIENDLWAAHWLVRHGFNAYAYDVAVSISEDAGRTWSEPIRPHADDTPTEHGFVSLYPVDDSVGIAWLDGRETLKNTTGDRIVGMTLRSAVLGSDGQFQESLVDPLVCDCCQTDVAVSSVGPLMVYRDRDQQEVRDIRLARHTSAGWAVNQLIARDDWQVFGCPVNGPAIDAAGDQVAVVWYTQGSGAPEVRFARSTDGGQTFSRALSLDPLNPMGRVDVIVDESGCALVSWIGRTDGDSAALHYASIGLDNQPSEVRTVAEISATRPSGFPRMARYGSGLLIAWTELSAESSRVRTEELPLACEAETAGP